MQKDRCKERVRPLSFLQRIHVLHRFHPHIAIAEHAAKLHFLSNDLDTSIAIGDESRLISFLMPDDVSSKLPLSVVLIAKNAERHLPRCLGSVKDIASEIIAGMQSPESNHGST